MTYGLNFFFFFFLLKLNKALLIESYKATHENLFTSIYYAVMEQKYE